MTRSQFRPFGISVVILSLSSIGFAAWGWLANLDELGISLSDALYRSLNVFQMGGRYYSSADWGGDWRINTGRWLGAIAFLLVAGKAIWFLFADSLVGMQVRSRREHLIIIGTHPVAQHLARAATSARTRVTWLVAPDDQVTGKVGMLYTEQLAWRLDRALEFGLKKASAVAICVSSDVSALSIAREIRSVVKPGDLPRVIVAMEALPTSFSLDDAPGVENVRRFSLPASAAREVISRHPPFEIARRRSDDRMHILIVGFGSYGEAIMIETLLSSLTSDLEKPLVTVIDIHAAHREKAFRLRYPELHKSAEIRFVDGCIAGYGAAIDEEDLVRLNQQTPIASVYVCLGDEALSFSTAHAIQAVFNRHGGLSGPICVRAASGRVYPVASAGVSGLASGQLISFGDFAGLGRSAKRLTDDAEELARQLHQGYRRAAAEGKSADVPWEDLDEDKRDANRRVANHLVAKLSSVGADVDDLLAGPESEQPSQGFDLSAALLANPKHLESLAELEHQRWMMDRRINGWRYGKTRNDKSKLHPDLVEWSLLSNDSKQYDREIIRTLANVLKVRRLDYL